MFDYVEFTRILKHGAKETIQLVSYCTSKNFYSKLTNHYVKLNKA